MPDLHITARQFKALVSPVLPCAADDDGLPTICAIHVESHGPWLVARATDRFRLGMKRLKATEGDWPEWSALLPTSTVKAIMADFKPDRHDSDPQLVLSIKDETLRVTADGALLNMLAADVTYPLRDGKFPNTNSLVRDAIAAEPNGTAHAAFNWKFLASFAGATGAAPGLQVRIPSPHKPALIANGDDFIGILMPRRTFSDNGDGFNVGEGWDALLADPKKDDPDKAPAKKPAAKRTRKKAAVAS